jgi:ATP-independent RNA helicase DbpA
LQHINLEKLGIQHLNELQLACLDAAKTHRELIVYAPTGSGKTLAFLLTALKNLTAIPSEIQVLIISPTRELVLQIESVSKLLTKQYKINAFYGGHSIKIEENNLTSIPAIVVATPGRLADHLRRGNINLNAVHTLVLDEFDKALEMGFEDDMRYILQATPHIQNRMLTSATKLNEIPSFAVSKQAATIDFCVDEPLNLEYFKLPHLDRAHEDLLFRLLCSFQHEKTIIFCNFRERVMDLAESLSNFGLVVSPYHGGMEQDERERALIRFRNGSSTVLISTSLASRGLDIPAVENIVHDQLPETENDFIQRNGRTARQDNSGKVYFFDDKSFEFLPQTKEYDIKKASVPAPRWKTIYINAGKKDKVNKVDLVGFLHQVGNLSRDEIGIINVLDRSSFVAISSDVAEDVVPQLRGQKIKGKKRLIGFAR